MQDNITAKKTFFQKENGIKTFFIKFLSRNDQFVCSVSVVAFGNKN